MAGLFEILSPYIPWIVGLLGIIVVGRLTGIDSYFIQFFNTVFGLIRDAVLLVINYLPKPFQIGIVLFLFVVLGGFIYNFTFGAQYICLEDDVVKVDYATGLTFKLFPDFEFIRTEERLKLDGRAGEIDDFENRTMKIEGTAVRYQDSAFLREDTYIQDNVRSEIVYNLVSFSDVQNAGFDELFRRYLEENEQQLFNEILFSRVLRVPNQEASYGICQNPKTNVCVLQRQSGVVDFPTRENTACIGDFNYKLGQITYFYDESSGLRVAYVDGRILPVFSYTLGGGVKTCEFYDDEDAGEFSIPSQGLLDPDPVIISVTPERDNARSTYQFPLYGATYSGFFMASAEQWNGTAYNDLRVQSSEGQRGVSDPDRPGVDELLGNYDIYENKENAIVKYACSEDSEDKYGTEMQVLGLNPLNPVYLGFFFLIGMIFSWYWKTGMFN